MATDVPPEPAEAERTWVQITEYPCALDDQGDVKCWQAEDFGPGTYDGRLPDGVVGEELVWFSTVLGLWGAGIRADHSSVLWHCVPPSIHCELPLEQYIYMNRNHGLRSDGQMVAVQLPFPEDFDTVWTNISRFSGAAVDSGNRLVVNLRGDPVEYFLDSEIVVHQVAVAAESTCTLDQLGTIRCFGEATVFCGGNEGIPDFLNPPYSELRGGTSVMCAQRTVDHVIECSGGQEFDFGPTVDFEIHAYCPSFWHPGTELPQREGLSICAITEDNGIVCEGERYPAELLERLPKGRSAN